MMEGEDRRNGAMLDDHTHHTGDELDIGGCLETVPGIRNPLLTDPMTARRELFTGCSRTGAANSLHIRTDE